MQEADVGMQKAEASGRAGLRQPARFANLTISSYSSTREP